MAETQPTWISCQDPTCYTPQDMRLHDSRLVCGEGVVIATGPELQVTQNVGDPLCVDIAQGGAWIDADLGGDCQGVYGVHNCGITTLCADDGDPTDPRIDRVVFQVNDSSLGGTQCDSELMIITGEPSPAPVAPAEPDNAITLALLTVTSAGITVISDERSPFSMCGGTARAPQMILDQQSAGAGSFNKADYPTASWFEVLIVGPGGGGGGVSAQGADNSAAAGGGSGGAGIRLRVTRDQMPDTVAWTVGAGGAGGGGGGAVNSTGQNGSDGGDTTFGDWTAAGGNGGQGGVSAATNLDITSIQIGGGVIFGTFGSYVERVAGCNSGYGFRLADTQLGGGPGGDGPFGLGVGGGGRGTPGNGFTGSYMGRGGSGAVAHPSTGGFVGGAGGDGAIQITAHY